MPGLILPQELNNPRAVADAFQASLNTIFNPQTVEWLMTNGTQYQLVEYVYSGALSVVGWVSLTLGDPEATHGVLHACAHMEGYSSEPGAVFVPSRVARYLALEISGTAQWQYFRPSEDGKTSQAQLQAIPQTFQDYPRGGVVSRG